MIHLMMMAGMPQQYTTLAMTTCLLRHLILSKAGTSACSLKCQAPALSCAIGAIPVPPWHPVDNSQKAATDCTQCAEQS